MGNIKVILPNELEQEFREEVFRRYGLRKGNLTIAVQEAIRHWVDQGHIDRKKNPQNKSSITEKGLGGPRC